MPQLPPEPFFSGPGLDRADMLRSNSEALRALAASSGARQLQWEDGLPKLSAEKALAFGKCVCPELFLGFDGETPCFSRVENVTADARAAFPRLALLDRDHAPVFAAAVSLSRWHSRNRFCGNCGGSTVIARGGWSRSCANCQADHYPRVDPVVIMLGQFGDRVLLGRQPRYPPRRYSALAGFVEVGETLEAAVVRELFEEAGVRVLATRYIASQPWPFPSSLMFGCFAQVESPELTIDYQELEDARWFTREQVSAAIEGRPEACFEPPVQTAIARTLLEHWLAA